MINIFVISLKDCIIRRKNILESTKKYGYEVIFIDAIDGRYNNLRLNKEYNSLLSKICYRRDLLSTEIGCFLSHIKTYEKIVNLNSDINLILEDDFLFNDEINNLINKIKEIKKLPFEFIRYCPKKDNTKYYLEKKVNGVEFNRMKGNVPGSYSYFINLEGAKKLYCQKKYLIAPIDIYFSYQFLTGIDKIIIFSSNHHNYELDSTISKKLSDSEPNTSKIIFYFTKLLFRNFAFLFNFFYYYYYFVLNIINLNNSNNKKC